MLNKKTCIGDGIYADFDGYYVWLTTEDDVSVTNKIALDPDVVAAMFGYITRLYEYYEAQATMDTTIEAQGTK